MNKEKTLQKKDLLKFKNFAYMQKVLSSLNCDKRTVNTSLQIITNKE